MDEILLFSDLEGSVDDVMKPFMDYFENQIAEMIDKFLGLSVEDRGDRIQMNTEVSIQRLLKFFKMANYKLTPSPLPVGLDLSPKTIVLLSDNILHRQPIGSLLYLADTVRRDISYAVGYLPWLMHKPTTSL